jgi:hypothetical protein
MGLIDENSYCSSAVHNLPSRLQFRELIHGIDHADGSFHDYIMITVINSYYFYWDFDRTVGHYSLAFPSDAFSIAISIILLPLIIEVVQMMSCFRAAVCELALICIAQD